MGVSTGAMADALAALVGPDAAGLSETTVSRLTKIWQEEFDAWNRRDLSSKQYVYFWVDGVYPKVRLEKENPCLLVIIGATAQGKKELVAVYDGVRESEERLGDDGRLVIRVSGTEPLIRIMGQADDEALVATIVGQISAAIRKAA